MKFEYKKFPLSKRSPIFGWSILRPVIPIDLDSGGKSLRYAAVIDSGADFCIFDGELGEHLGIDVRSGPSETFRGVHEREGGTPATAYFHEVGLNVGGHRHSVVVSFSYNLSLRAFGLLGQRGFFDLFIVKFDLAKEEIELKYREKK